MIQDQFYTFFDAEKYVEEFERILNANGIKIACDSELERLCLNVIRLVEKHLNPQSIKQDEDIRPYFRECLGLSDLLIKLIKSSNHPNFSALLPYLNKINYHNPIQNTKTSVLDQYNNKLFELYIAMLCLNLEGCNLSVDDPDHSIGNNPDIIVKIEDRVWGFACKTLHSKKPMTIFENIVKAVSQIENSSAEVGIPIINIKNIIDHDIFWPASEDKNGEKIFGAYPDMLQPLAVLERFCKNMVNEIICNIGMDNVKQLFQGKKSFPSVFLYCSTALSILIDNHPYPTRFNYFMSIAFGDMDSQCQKVCEKLNHELQII